MEQIYTDTRKHSSGLQSVKYAICHPSQYFLAYAFVSAWSQVAFSGSFSPLEGDSISLLSIIHLIGSVSAAVTALLLALFCGHGRPLSSRRILALLIGILGFIASTIISILSTTTLSTPLVALYSISNVVICVSSIYLTIACFELFAKQSIRSALVSFAYATIISSILVFIINIIPENIAAIITVLLPLVCVCIIVFVHSTQTQIEVELQKPASTTKDRISPLRSLLPPIVIAGLASYASGVFINMGLLDITTDSVVLSSLGSHGIHMLVMLAAVIVASLFLKYRINIVFGISVCCILVASILLFIWEDAAIVATCFARVGVEALFFLAFVAIVRAIENRHVSATMAFGLLVFSQFLGTATGQILQIIFSENNTVTALLLMAVLVIMLLFAFLSQESSETQVEQIPPTEDMIDKLILEHPLTPRELEVARLWVAGHNSAHIEEALGISKHTVKTHLKSIYEKTGTSDKEELINMVEQQAHSRD